MYAIAIESREVVHAHSGVVTKAGDRFVISENGEAVRFSGRLPLGTLTFRTEGEAKVFLKGWMPRPWSVKPASSEVIRVEPIYEEVVVGWRQLTKKRRSSRW